MSTVNSHPALSDVAAVFGGNRLGGFLRGGGRVPNISANSGVPTSAPLRLSQLAGATNYQALSASAGNVSEIYPNTVSSNVTVGSSTCNTTGGSGTISYSWTKVSGDTFIVTAPSSKTTEFQHTAKINGTFSGVYRCAVSDGTSSAHADITVTLRVGTV